MASDFFDISKEVANNFLQNIVFIDDKAFNSIDEKTNHDFDAYTVTQSFAAKNKICAIYKPKTSADIELLAELAKKADITVLDWQINLEEEPIPEGMEEEDAENDDPRGPHTLKIIREILSDPLTGEGSLKLIIVYTGETGLQDIRNDIHKDLATQGIAVTITDFEVLTDNVKIIIVAKSDNEIDEHGNPKSRFNLIPEFNARVKSYEQLPDFILDEFAKMTSGLLSNFVLESLTILRNNTFRLIKLYNKGLDLAFLTHYLLLPAPEDSKEQMVDIFSDSVQALLHYNQAGKRISITDIKNWLGTREFNKPITVSGKAVHINTEFIKVWLEKGFAKAIAEQWREELSEDQEKAAGKEKEKLSRSLSPLTNENIVNDKDIEFSILTHHKSIFKPSAVFPRLTLGAVVKGSQSGYWVCIQQRCDSVRLTGVTRFLFLPLKDVTGDLNAKFNFATSDGKRLKLSKKSFDLRTIKFAALEGEDSIKATTKDNKFVFEPLYRDGHADYNNEKDEVYEWVLDLKDLHAQRIAAEFAHELSRVGLDESEWLRRRS
ncbi:MAG TPA: response regulator receiver domain [Niabella sp.]|nr:response regulator receiver domain [Niabella sp.]